jgi:hypothetical protein
MTGQNKIATIIRWVARISGSLIVVFILFFLLAHIFGEDESGNGFRNTKEMISFLFFPISPVIGLSLALKWDGLGGIFTIIGMIGLFVVRPDLLNHIVMIPIIPGVLYTIYWIMTKNKIAHKNEYNS